MEHNGIEISQDQSSSGATLMKKPENSRSFYARDVVPGSDLWKDGLICAFEFVRGRRRSVNSKSAPRIPSKHLVHESSKTPMSFIGLDEYSSPHGSNLVEPSRAPVLNGEQRAFHEHKQQLGQCPAVERLEDSHWVAIGWARISELVQKVQVDADWATHPLELMDDDDDITVADLAAPYWERPAGPVWWCHVDAGHPYVQSWLSNAPWLHPAISLALRDEGRLISDKMKHLLYEVPVRVAGGLLFELLGQSAGDPFVDEDDIPVVLRSWQAQNFLVTALHIKGKVSRVNVLGITEVQELLSSGGYYVPRTAHEVIAQLASRLTRWDDRRKISKGPNLIPFDGLKLFLDGNLQDFVFLASLKLVSFSAKNLIDLAMSKRLFRKSIFGAADEIELKFVNRRNHEDMNLFSVILNQEIRRLSKQVIRVKWSLHAREEIIFELLHHLRGNGARALLGEIRKCTREMLEEQEAVRGRLFTIQDVMQSTVRAWLQDRSLRVTHNLAVFGGCGLVLSIITGLFGINVDGIPGSENTPYAFGLFAVVLFFIGMVLIGVGLIYLGLKKPITEEQVEVRKLELQELVKMFQHEAESHVQVRKNMFRNNLPPTSGDVFTNDVDYLLIQ